MQTCVFESTILRGSTNSYGFCRPNGKSSRAFAHISSGPDLATPRPPPRSVPVADRSHRLLGGGRGTGLRLGAMCSAVEEDAAPGAASCQRVIPQMSPSPRGAEPNLCLPQSQSAPSTSTASAEQATTLEGTKWQACRTAGARHPTRQHQRPAMLQKRARHTRRCEPGHGHGRG